VQALKEFTFSFDQTIANGFLMREELRHDFSNQPYFLTDTLGVLKNDQTAATGTGLLVWRRRRSVVTTAKRNGARLH
jgi:hypothetical protein